MSCMRVRVKKDSDVVELSIILRTSYDLPEKFQGNRKNISQYTLERYWYGK